MDMYGENISSILVVVSGIQILSDVEHSMPDKLRYTTGNEIVKYLTESTHNE